MKILKMAHHCHFDCNGKVFRFFSTEVATVGAKSHLPILSRNMTKQ